MKKTVGVAPSSRDFFVNGMRGHSAVISVRACGDNVYIIERTRDRKDLKVLIADIYIAGAADIVEIRDKYDDIDAVVLVGYYNRYSLGAKDMAKSMNLGLFDRIEFWGAVNYSGTRFLNYEKKHDDKK